MKQILLIFTLFTAGLAIAQDLNFSQVRANPVWLNPANTGNFNGRFRVGAQFKSQWGSVTAPFVSIAAHSDFAFLKKGMGRQVTEKGDWIGAGVQLSSDKAGDGNLQVIRINGTFAYHKAFDNFQRKVLSFGVYGGIIQRSINFQALYFEDQWNGERFQTNIPSIDYAKDENVSAIDFGVGAQYTQILSKANEPVKMFGAGFAINHPTGIITDYSGESVLNLKPVFNAYANWGLDNQITICPYTVAQFQNKSDFILLGADVRYQISPQNENQKVIAGAYGKLNGDLILNFGMDVFGYQFIMSYDANLGPVSEITSGRGGIEFSILKSGPRPRGVDILEF